MPPTDAPVPEDYAGLHDQAVALLQDPKLAAGVNRLLTDDRWARQLSERPALGDQLGLDVPEGLDVRVIGFGKPGPDWVPFTLRLTGCRHYWVRAKDGKYKREEVCLGFEIVPNVVPGGPWG
jgi:hypothetical protein